MTHYPTDHEAKLAILSSGLRLYSRGLVAGNDGNLSVRVGSDALWTTPTAVSKGTMTEAMLVKVTLDGTILEGSYRPSSELKLHLRLYQERPDLGAVLHAHPPAATSFAAAGLPLNRPVLQEAVLQLGEVPLVPYALPGSEALAEGVVPYVQGTRALLLEFHGAVTWGNSLEQALFRMETLEQYATVTLHLRTLGVTRELPSSLVQELIALRERLGL